jgi:hypothetical protein
MAGLFSKAKNPDRKGALEWLFVETSLFLFVKVAVKMSLILVFFRGKSTQA